MLYKLTKKLFYGTYQYKIVLVCAGASWFRSGDMDEALDRINKAVLPDKNSSLAYTRSRLTQEDLDYARKLQHRMKKMVDFELRVEAPWISIYTNDKADVDKLIKLDADKIKYVSSPPANKPLDENTIIMPKVNFEFKVTLGKTTTSHDAFVGWAENNAKVKLTNGCRKELVKARSWGGTYFYITGDKNLLMAKMHLGGSINKIERIIKA